MIDYGRLATELRTDPRAIGYGKNVTDGSDTFTADAINLARPEIQIERNPIPAHEVLEAFPADAWPKLSTNDLLYLLLLCSGGQVWTGANTLAALTDIFTRAGASIEGLGAILHRPGSRAEELFGAGAVVRHQDVGAALGRGSA